MAWHFGSIILSARSGLWLPILTTCSSTGICWPIRSVVEHVSAWQRQITSPMGMQAAVGLRRVLYRRPDLFLADSASVRPEVVREMQRGQELMASPHAMTAQSLSPGLDQRTRAGRLAIGAWRLLRPEPGTALSTEPVGEEKA